MNNPDSRPAIEVRLSNMEDYDTVFLGFPDLVVWRRPLSTPFFGKLRFCGQKQSAPFATSGGSGMGETVEDAAASLPGAHWGAGQNAQPRFGSRAGKLGQGPLSEAYDL